MPLTRKVTFKGKLQKAGRVQIPKMIRWEFKIEADQVLKVGFSITNKFKGWQFFYAKIGKDGRIFIPETALAPWQNEKTSISGVIVEITLEPA
jgi:hypothetical protein